MKIAMLIARFPPAVGGAEIQCYRLSRWLAHHGHEVTVLTERSSPDEPPDEHQDGIRVIRFKTWGPLPFSSWQYGIQTFFYLIRHRAFDLLHAHMLATPAIVAMAAGSVLHIPVLVKITGRQQMRNAGIKWWLLKHWNPWVACPSQELVKDVQSFGVSVDKLVHLPNGVDAEHFKPLVKPSASFRSPLPWSDEILTAIYVGRWAKGKGVEKILEVWEKGMEQSGFPWHLVMILSSPAPKEEAHRLHRLKGRVHLVIQTKDPLPFYQASHLAVLLSESEGMSNFLLEAMASGLPTLSTKAAALPDVSLKNGAWILNAEENMTREAVQKLTDFAAHAESLAPIGRTAREFIEERYAFDRIGQSYLSFYRKMLN